MALDVQILGQHPDGDLVELGEPQQRSGKIVTVWAVEGDVDQASVVPGISTMEWPRGSGVERAFPEIDRVEGSISHARGREDHRRPAAVPRLVGRAI